jgi:hypothetical protein
MITSAPKEPGRGVKQSHQNSPANAPARPCPGSRRFAPAHEHIIANPREELNLGGEFSQSRREFLGATPISGNDGMNESASVSVSMASRNKCLAGSNKSGTEAKAAKRSRLEDVIRADRTMTGALRARRERLQETQ